MNVYYVHLSSSPGLVPIIFKNEFKIPTTHTLKNIRDVEESVTYIRRYPKSIVSEKGGVTKWLDNEWEIRDEEFWFDSGLLKGNGRRFEKRTITSIS